MAITNDWMCVSLNLSVPATFHVSVDLVTNTSTKTVYTVDNVLAETAATDMLTIFEVQVDATKTNNSQLVIYVSEGTVIRNVDMLNDHCNGAGKFVLVITANDRLSLLAVPARPAKNITQSDCSAPWRMLLK